MSRQTERSRRRGTTRRRAALGLLLLVLVAPGVLADSAAPERPDPEEVVVTAQRRPEPRLEPGLAIQRLGRDELARSQARHPHELFRAVPGAWVLQGSGQEHQIALRSPILGGAGGCGGVLILENGVPVRPAGFCTINQLTEVAIDLADSVEVLRGPGTALHGANAVHGVINVLMPSPGSAGPAHGSLAVGSDNYGRGRFSLPVGGGATTRLSGGFARESGFREASGHRQARLHLAHERSLLGGNLKLGLTATRLRQDTAGFIYGRDAYRDRALARSNPDAGAFRDADAQRLYARWTGEWRGMAVDLRPYLRHSSMSFMHYALPGRPVEDNGQHSAGLLLAMHRSSGAGDWSFGLDLDRASVYLRQRQDETASGPPRVRATRPVGGHYDYEVRSLLLAPFARWAREFGDRWRLEAGLRWESMAYDYDNHLPDGNVRDDGQPCGFGGCVYSRPADRSDRFGEAAPSLSASYRTGEDSMVYARLARGFRFPQTIELYRLQNGQRIADLAPEVIESVEAGWRVVRPGLALELAAYAMRKRDGMFRDAEGFNVSGARSRHEGVELDLEWSPLTHWRLRMNASHGRHRYDFDFAPNRGERFVSGRDMDSAPRWLGHVELRRALGPRLDVSLRWTHLGEYYLDPENRYRYPGHDLLDLQAAWRLNGAYRVLFQLNNLTDRAYADRADFGRGDYRYLPGRGRSWNIEVQYRPD